MTVVYCPRLGNESDEMWKKRYEQCRRTAMRNSRGDITSLFDLYELQCFALLRRANRVIVARQPSYEMEFHKWVLRTHIEVVDAMDTAHQLPAWIQNMRRN